MDVRRHGSRVVVAMAGVIDENADLAPLTSIEAQSIELDLDEIRRINSFGVRAWISAVSQIPRSIHLELSNCRPPIVDQCNAVAGFLAHGAVKSFYGMMACPDCDSEHAQLFDAQRCRNASGALPPVKCPRCGADMGLDDLEDYYLSFLRR